MIINNTIFHDVVHGHEKDMYIRGHNYICADDKLYFIKGSGFDTNTFYNSFSVSKWNENCPLDDLIFNVSGQGRVKISVFHSTIHKVPELLTTSLFDLTDNAEINIPGYVNLTGGLIFVGFEPLTDGYIDSANFSTTTIPRNNVKLGLVITHFNRQEAIQASTQRIANELLSDSAYQGKIHLTVVDNSQNSGVKERDGLKVINNLNLGGSGGFSRGLLELDEEGSYTHCLFMDDDASCETESIRRTYQMLQYANDPKLAISGALLREDKRNIIWEKAASFDGICKPKYPNMDMLDPKHLLIVDQKDDDDIYGAWWYFAFNIKEVQHYPIPFFVRGDDISFSLVNDLKIITVNGIASYGEDFGLKSGAMPLYLDVRSHLVEQIQMLGHEKTALCKTVSKFFISALFSYNYGTARAILQAANDFMEGPRFFADNKDMQNRFGVIKEYAKKEVMTSDAFKYEDLDFRHLNESKVKYFLRLITLNGLLIPSLFFHKKTVFQPKGFRANFREIFRYSKVRYVNTIDNTSYVAEINRKEFFKLSIQLLKTLVKLFSNFERLQKLYKKELPSIMSKEFWLETYKK